MPTGGKSGGGASNGGGSGAIRAGRAFVELFGDDTKLTRTIARVQKKLNDFGKFFMKVGAGLGAGGSALLAPLAALLKTGIDRADQIGDVADVFGLTAESASKMASAFEIAGGSIEDFETALGKLAAANTSGKPLDEYFYDVADSINAIENASARFQAAKEIFGDKFARKFIDSSGDVMDLVKNAPTLSADEIKRSKQLNVELARTWVVLKSAMLPTLEIIGPIIKGFLQFAQANAKVLTIVGAVGVGLVVAGASITLLGLGFSGLALSIGIAAKAFAVILSPIGLVAVALAGLTYLFVTQTNSGKAWATSMVSGFKTVAGVATTAFGGIMDALRAGDLALAGEIALKGLEVVWRTGVVAMTDVWNTFKRYIVDSWHEVGYGVSLIWETMVHGVSVAIIRAGQFIIAHITAAVQKMLGISAAVASKLGLSNLTNTLDNASAIVAGWNIDVQGFGNQIVTALDRMHDDVVADIGKRSNEEQKARDALRDERLQAANEELNKARDELDALRQRAAALAIPQVAAAGGGLDKLPSQIQLLNSVRGGFASTSATQQFAFGKTTNEKLGSIAKNTGVLPMIHQGIDTLIDTIADTGTFT